MAPDLEAPGPGVLVREVTSLLAAMERLYLLNDSVCFWNADRSLRCGLRHDPSDDDDGVGFELYVVVDEDDPGAKALFDMSDDGYVDDDGTFVLHRWTFRLASFGPEDAATVASVINRLYLYRVCRCSKYLIKDDAFLCVFCQMTATIGDRAVVFCPICCEDGVAMHMTCVPCCQQTLHTRCLEAWHAKRTPRTCPLCRAPAA